MKSRCAELVCGIAGACLLIKGGWNLGNYAAFQSHPQWFLSSSAQASSNREQRALLPIALQSRNGLKSLADVKIVGKLDVPRLGMSVLVVEGDDEKKLGLAAGHIPGTAAFGQIGNSVVAGHRDTSFWPLRRIRIGDRVRVRAGRTYEYVVSSVRIVGPDDLTVLRSTDSRTLTLITCYPFRYFGSAPKRFIVQAAVPNT